MVPVVHSQRELTGNAVLLAGFRDDVKRIGSERFQPAQCLSHPPHVRGNRTDIAEQFRVSR